MREPRHVFERAATNSPLGGIAAEIEDQRKRLQALLECSDYYEASLRSLPFASGGVKNSSRYDV